MWRRSSRSVGRASLRERTKSTNRCSFRRRCPRDPRRCTTSPGFSPKSARGAAVTVAPCASGRGIGRGHGMAISSEPGLFSGWGTVGGRVNVRLRADGELVAVQLQERYGDAVDLTVGFLHFPEVLSFSHSQAPLIADQGRPKPRSLPDELHVEVDEDLEVRSGANLQSTIRLTNEGDEEVVAHTNGRLTARVLDPKTNETRWRVLRRSDHASRSISFAGRWIGRNPLADRDGIDHSTARLRRPSRSMGDRDHSWTRIKRVFPTRCDPARRRGLTTP